MSNDFLGTWEAIRSRPTRRSLIAYWNYPVSDRLRASVKRAEGGGFEWKIHRRDDPRYGWSNTESGTAPTLPAAKRAAVDRLMQEDGMTTCRHCGRDIEHRRIAESGITREPVMEWCVEPRKSNVLPTYVCAGHMVGTSWHIERYHEPPTTQEKP